jgi:hypothetical protein
MGGSRSVMGCHRQPRAKQLEEVIEMNWLCERIVDGWSQNGIY